MGFDKVAFSKLVIDLLSDDKMGPDRFQNGIRLIISTMEESVFIDNDARIGEFIRSVIEERNDERTPESTIRKYVP